MKAALLRLEPYPPPCCCGRKPGNGVAAGATAVAAAAGAAAGAGPNGSKPCPVPDGAAPRNDPTAPRALPGLLPNALPEAVNGSKDAAATGCPRPGCCWPKAGFKGTATAPAPAAEGWLPRNEPEAPCCGACSPLLFGAPNVSQEPPLGLLPGNAFAIAFSVTSWPSDLFF